MDLEKLELNCERIPDILRTEEIIMINNLITDPDNMVDVGLWEDDNKIRDVELGGPELEIGRDEDYHQVKSRGLIETLIESMIPMECR